MHLPPSSKGRESPFQASLTVWAHLNYLVTSIPTGAQLLDGERRGLVPHAEQPLRLARGQPRRTEHDQQPLCHVAHCGQGVLRAVPTI